MPAPVRRATSPPSDSASRKCFSRRSLSSGPYGAAPSTQTAVQGGADQTGRGRARTHGDDDTLARRPGRADAVLFAIGAHVHIDEVGGPTEGDFAKSKQVATTKEVPQSGRRLLGHVDLSLAEPGQKLFRRDIDEFDLVGSRTLTVVIWATTSFRLSKC